MIQERSEEIGCAVVKKGRQEFLVSERENGRDIEEIFGQRLKNKKSRRKF